MKTFGAFLAFMLFCAATFKTDSNELAVSNQTANDLGMCTFSSGMSNVEIEVGPNANINDPIGFTVDSVTIAGQGVSEPNPGPVLLPNGAKVAVIWPSPNFVEIINSDQTNRPAQ